MPKGEGMPEDRKPHEAGGRSHSRHRCSGDELGPSRHREVRGTSQGLGLDQPASDCQVEYPWREPQGPAPSRGGHAKRPQGQRSRRLGGSRCRGQEAPAALPPRELDFRTSRRKSCHAALWRHGRAQASKKEGRRCQEEGGRGGSCRSCHHQHPGQQGHLRGGRGGRETQEGKGGGKEESRRGRGQKEGGKEKAQEHHHRFEHGRFLKNHSGFGGRHRGLRRQEIAHCPRRCHQERCPGAGHHQRGSGVVLQLGAARVCRAEVEGTHPGLGGWPR
mmetsp:Transcript_78594/g.163305  ORF Transcript_78594/g.163305 Transcript_78594/m.163305 type:complete len:275 (+) Transcript_78594:2600-3424(+)